MAINEQELILTAREMLTELPEAVHFSRENLRALIQPAIWLWQEKINDDPRKREQFIVESDAITISQGQADISTEVDAKGFRLDFIRDSDIVIAYGLPNYTVKFVNSLNRLSSIGRQDKFYVLAYMSGSHITFKDAGSVDIDDINGSFTLRSIALPTSLDALPSSAKAELSIILADLAKTEIGQQNRGLDVPPEQ
jgi:hypothetical protein